MRRLLSGFYICLGVLVIGGIYEVWCGIRNAWEFMTLIPYLMGLK